MALAHKLALALLGIVGLVFGLYTLLSIRWHGELYRTDVERDQAVLGQALATAVSVTWTERGRDTALALIEAANVRRQHIGIRWIPVESFDRDEVSLAADTRRTLRAGGMAKGVVLRGEGAGAQDEWLYTYVPIEREGQVRGALELSESLASQREYVRSRVLRTLAAAAAMVLLCGGTALVLGELLVGRPVRALAETTRRIGQGDFSSRLDLRQGREFRKLSEEINDMAAALRAAREALDEQTRARIHAIEQLRHADRLTTVGQLASGVAHELGTPLNVLAERAKMIEQGELEASDEIQHSARIVRQQAERMAAIVRQLLDFARSGRPEKATVDVLELARATTRLLAPLAQGRDVKLAEPTGRSVRFHLDAVRLQQALTNLVVNAVDASGSGGRVGIAVSRAPGSGDLQISVHDDGPGIPEDALPRVFDPFFTTKPVGEGTGLGLAVADGIVREHGGTIEVCSEVGKGATFRIRIPEGHESREEEWEES